MGERKSYRQFCGLARSLDHVGDRWTLLVVRELLIGPSSFRDLQRRLAVSPAMLTTRLRDMEADGLIHRNDAAPRSKAVIYALTEAGRELEPVLLELIRWGARWMVSGPGDDRYDPRWTMLAVKALLSGRRPADDATASVSLSVGEMEWALDLRSGSVEIQPGAPTSPDVRVTGTMPDMLALFSRSAPIATLDLEVTGDADILDQVLGPTPEPHPGTA